MDVVALGADQPHRIIGARKTVRDADNNGVFKSCRDGFVQRVVDFCHGRRGSGREFVRKTVIDHLRIDVHAVQIILFRIVYVKRQQPDPVLIPVLFVDVAAGIGHDDGFLRIHRTSFSSQISCAAGSGTFRVRRRDAPGEIRSVTVEKDAIPRQGVSPAGGFFRTPKGGSTQNYLKYTTDLPDNQ